MRSDRQFIKWLEHKKVDHTIVMIARLLREVPIELLPPTLQRTIQPYIDEYLMKPEEVQ